MPLGAFLVLNARVRGQVLLETRATPPHISTRLSLGPLRGVVSGRSPGLTHEAWVRIPILSLTSSLTLGETFSFLPLGFLIFFQKSG